MNIEIEAIFGIPTDDQIRVISHLEKECFGDSLHTDEMLKKKFEDQQNVIILLAKNSDKYIGFKVGYDRKTRQFYSWIGGVDPKYRGNSIARTLMDKQHEILKEKNYKCVRTHTENRFKKMLILNLKMGFDIMGTCMSRSGKLKLILEKEL